MLLPLKLLPMDLKHDFIVIQLKEEPEVSDNGGNQENQNALASS